MWKRLRGSIGRMLGGKGAERAAGRDDANATHPSMPVPVVAPGGAPPIPDPNNTRPIDLGAVGIPAAPDIAPPETSAPAAPPDLAPPEPVPPEAPASPAAPPALDAALAPPATPPEPASAPDPDMPPAPAENVAAPVPAAPDMPTDAAEDEAGVAAAVDDDEEDEEDEEDDGTEDEGGEDEDEWDDEEVGGPRGRERGPFVGDRVVFGEELWGVSARHRGAALDEARLARFDLPVLRTEAELTAWLGVALSRLRWYTFDRAADTTWHYVRYVVPKRSGGERVILAPKRELKALQRRVLDGIVARVPVASAAHGFVRGRSIVTNARQHSGKRVVLKLDLKDFFPSITFPRVRGLFLALGYGYGVASALALLCTEYEREAFERDETCYYISIGPRHLVQGAPTSPALANLAAWRLDRRMSGLAARRGYSYTRYADDLTFSGDDGGAGAQVQGLRQVAQRIVADEHFTVNTAKTRVARRSARQVVTGLVVNDGVATPRQLRRRLRAMLHNAERTGLEAQNRDGRANFRAYVQGQIAHVHAAHAEHAARLRAALRRLDGGS